MNRDSTQLKADFLLLLVTMIWGSTFVVVKDAVSKMPPFAFIAARFYLAFVLLALVYGKRIIKAGPRVWTQGVLIGAFLFSGYAFQTAGLKYTTASKAGFITGLSVVIVPVVSAFLLRKPPGLQTSAGAFLAAAGLGLLSLGEGLIPAWGDVLVFFCSVSFAGHILAVGRYSAGSDPGALAAVQILTTAVLSHILSAVTEIMPTSIPPDVWGAVASTGILATAVAFLIQTSTQRFTTATHTALIFSMEPVFAALFAFILAGERMTGRGWLGAGLILMGILLSEIRPKRKITRGYDPA